MLVNDLISEELCRREASPVCSAHSLIRPPLVAERL